METDRHTYGLTNATDCFTYSANAVGKDRGVQNGPCAPLFHSPCCFGALLSLSLCQQHQNDQMLTCHRFTLNLSNFRFGRQSSGCLTYRLSFGFDCV